MKFLGGFIGWIVGMFIGFALANTAPFFAFVFIVGGIFVGRYIGGQIEESRNRERKRQAEEQRRQQREFNEQQRRIRESNQRVAEAQALARKYPAATRHYFQLHWGIVKPFITNVDITDERAKVLLTHKYSYDKDEQTYNPAYRAKIEAEKQEKIRKEAAEREAVRQAELARQRAKEQLIKNLPNKVLSWNKFHSVPYFFFYYYYPTRFTDVTSESQKARRLIWNFKDGMPITPPVYKLVGDKLKQTFTSDELKELTFVGIPASTRQSNKDRYEDFCKKLCEYTGMRNAFPHITIEKEKKPKHLSPTHESEPAVYEFNRSFFQDARVILFDDVVTQGNSLLAMKLRMERVLGATVIAAISLGRTYSDYRGDNRQPHPYSGIL